MNRYDENWAGREGTQWRVVLDGADVRTTGRPVQVQLEEDDDEDFFVPVRSWTGKLTLMPAGAQEAAATVTLQSRLATAGGRYLDADGGRGFVTLGALLREALLLCGFSDGDAIVWPSRWATAEGEPGLSVLGLRVSRGRFFADNQGGGDTEEGTEVDAADGKERTPFEVMTTADVAGRDGGGDALGGDAEDGERGGRCGLAAEGEGEELRGDAGGPDSVRAENGAVRGPVLLGGRGDVPVPDQFYRGI